RHYLASAADNTPFRELPHCDPHHLGRHPFPTRRSSDLTAADVRAGVEVRAALAHEDLARVDGLAAEALHAEALCVGVTTVAGRRSEEHTSELQSRENLVCRLLLGKKNTEDTKEQSTSRI